MPLAELGYGADEGLSSRWEQMFLLLSCCLASTVILKVAQIQYLELVYGLQICVLLSAFARSGWQATLLRPIGSLMLLYGMFLSGALLLSILALQRDFYLPGNLSTFKQPVVISFVRSLELLASLVAVAYLSHLFARDDRKARFAMRVYFRVGVLSALFSMVFLPLTWLNVAFLGFPETRMRGFYNEGGPYGLYVLSVIFVAVSLYQLRWERRDWLLGGAFLLPIAFFGSQSKSAIVALIVMGAVNLFLLRTIAQRVAVISVVLITLFTVTQFVDFTRGLRSYREASLAYERSSYLHKNDANYVIGRVAGAFIVPRMIAEHPLTGVGWGNYSLVRNAPEYRGASAWVDLVDEPALGIAGLAAELGLPLTGLLVCCLLFPAALLRRRRLPSHMVNLALVQPIVHLCGAQLNLTYPWIVTAFALGLAFRGSQVYSPRRAHTLTSNLAYGQGT